MLLGVIAALAVPTFNTVIETSRERTAQANADRYVSAVRAYVAQENTNGTRTLQNSPNAWIKAAQGLPAGSFLEGVEGPIPQDATATDVNGSGTGAPSLPVTGGVLTGPVTFASEVSGRFYPVAITVTGNSASLSNEPSSDGPPVTVAPLALSYTATQFTTGSNNQTLTASVSGGSGAKTYSITSGSLPTGVTFDSATGTFTGPASNAWGATAVSAGDFATCGLSGAGGMSCWGRNSDGQTNVPAGLQTGGVAEISAGRDFACALTTSGGIQCWGNTGNGRINVPAGLQTSGAISVSAGAEHACAVTTAGAVVCWGKSDQNRTTVPAGLQTGGAISVSAGNTHTCAVTTAGAVVCWGDSGQGRTTVPAGLQTSGAIDVSAGVWHTCAVTTAGAVVCWGDNSYGRTIVPAGLQTSGAIDVTTGEDFTCALGTNAGITCWGRNDYGQLTIPAALQSGAGPFPANVTVQVTDTTGSQTTNITLTKS